MDISRRRFMAAGLCGCMLCSGSTAWAAGALPSVKPLIGAGYQPIDTDEKGLWQQCDRLEEELSSSNQRMKAPDLHSFTVKTVEQLLGPQAKDLRIYLMHDGSFNAAMFPNGMMLVNSGFLARIRNTAQFAAVLGHEAGHFVRKHSVAGWRNYRAKTGLMAFVSAGAAVAIGAGAGGGSNAHSWVDLANSISSALLLSIFSFSREQETEADIYGLKLISDAGYAPEAAAEVWRQLIEERKASAAQRGKRYRDGARSVFSTHPPSDERMTGLSGAAVEIRKASSDKAYDDGRDAWLKAVGPYRAMLLDEQVKLNDPGASLFLINSLAADGWTGTLRFYEGEIYRLRGDEGDAERAITAYAAAVQHGDAPAEAWRAHGYALLKANRGEEGRTALTRYLELKPDAKDAGMVRFTLAQ